jgi:hypothetical protein
VATDQYSQSITIPALTDPPNVATLAASITSVLARSLLRYSSATARNAALASPVEGMAAWLQDVNQLTVYNGTAWIQVPWVGPWTPLVMSGSWAWTSSSTDGVPSVRATSDGILELSGIMTGVALTGGAAAVKFASLPAGFSTTYLIRGQCNTQANGALGTGRIAIQPGGDVSISVNQSILNSSYVQLDGVRGRAS